MVQVFAKPSKSKEIRVRDASSPIGANSDAMGKMPSPAMGARMGAGTGGMGIGMGTAGTSSGMKKQKLGVRPLRRLVSTMWLTKGAFIAALVSTFMVTAFDIIIPMLSGSAVDVATGQSDTPLATVVTILVIVALARYVFQFGRRFTAGLLSNSLQHTLRLQIMESLLRLDGPAQDKLRSGQLVSRSISDLNLTQAMVAMLPMTIGHLLKVVGTIAVLVWISPVLSLIALAVMPVLIALTFLSRRTLFAATWSAQQAVADLATHVEETTTGVRVVKAFAQEEREITKLERIARDIYAKMIRQGRMQARFQPAVQQLPAFANIAGIGVGGYLALHGHITVGTFLAFSVYLSSLTAVASMVAGMIVQMQLGYASAARVFEVIDLAPEVPDPAHPATMIDGQLGLELSGVTFSMTTPAGTDHRILDELSFRVDPGATLAIVGPAGSGKSIAMNVIAGFYRPRAGRICFFNTAGDTVDLASLARADVRQAIGYCSDEPFLFSASIRENITMGRDFSEEEIIAAAKGAQAHEFISALEEGYDQVIGERGLTLSGGQRQRIALARVLIHNPRILLLDDATSAIDAETERRIYAHLKEHFADTTIVAIAHRHSTLELADTVAMVDHGRLLAAGTLPEMQEIHAFSQLMDYQPAPHRAGEDPVILLDQEGSEPPLDALWPRGANAAGAMPAMSSSAARMSSRAAGANPMSGGVPARGGRGGMATAAATPATQELLERVAKLPPATAVPPGDAARFRASLGKVSAHALFSHVRWLILGVIVLYVVGVAAGLAVPSLIRVAIDKGVQMADEQVLWKVTALGAGIVLLAWAINVATTILTTTTGERLLFELRIRSYSHLQRLGMDYYERTMSGTILTRMTTDIDALNTFLQTGLANTVVALTTLVGIMVLLAITSPLLALIALVGIPIIAVATVYFRRYSTTMYTRAREEVSSINAYFHESIAGLRAMQLHGMESFRLQEFGSKAKRFRDTRIRTQAAVAIYFPGINAVSELAQAATLAVGVGLVADGRLGTGVLVAFLLYLDRLYTPIQHLSQVFDNYQQAQVGFRRISDLLATAPSIVDKHDAATSYPPHVVANRATKDVAFKDVAFSYGQQLPLVTEHLSVTIQAGSTVAVVGPTGAGKSTFIKLIERFYDPVHGVVTAGDTDLKEFPVHGWRSRIGFVPQEAHLFSGTIADNIAYGRPEATREEITDAARRVGALSAIAAIPGGFHARIGERGLGLSSGQRQLVALARAEMCQPAIMLLDEATATLDPATEATILKASERVTQSRTSVVVAHRLATAARADRILVVDEGTIVEDGTHEQLLTFGGRYATLWGGQ